MYIKKALTVYFAIVLLWLSLWIVIATTYRDDLFEIIMAGLLALSNVFIASNMIYMLKSKGVTNRGGYRPMIVTVSIAVSALVLWNTILPNTQRWLPPFMFIPWITTGWIAFSLITLLFIAYMNNRGM